MSKITPFLWFDQQAEEATRFYISIFDDSRLGEVSRYGEAGPGPAGAVMGVTFVLEGQELFALNGGPTFHFTEAISLFVSCETQAEIDDKWERLSAGGKKGQCGWLKDKYGLSWQLVPPILHKLLADKDAAKSQRVMRAMMKMTKLDIGLLKSAAEQG